MKHAFVHDYFDLFHECAAMNTGESWNPNMLQQPVFQI